MCCSTTADLSILRWHRSTTAPVQPQSGVAADLQLQLWVLQLGVETITTGWPRLPLQQALQLLLMWKQGLLLHLQQCLLSRHLLQNLLKMRSQSTTTSVTTSSRSTSLTISTPQTLPCWPTTTRSSILPQWRTALQTVKEAEEALMEILQNHCMARPHRYIRARGEDILLFDQWHRVGPLQAVQLPDFEVDRLEGVTYESPATPALLERPQSALDYIIVIISSDLGRTTGDVPYKHSTLAWPECDSTCAHHTWTHGLLREEWQWLQGDGEPQRPLQMTTWSIRPVLVTGCACAYVPDLLTAKFYRACLIDVTTVNGINYSSVSSLRRLLWNHKTQGRTVNCIKGSTTHVLAGCARYSRWRRASRNYTIRQEEGLQFYYDHGRLRYGDRCQAHQEAVTTTAISQRSLQGVDVWWSLVHYSTNWITTTWAVQLQPWREGKATTPCGVETTPLQAHYHTISWWLQQQSQ